MALQHLRSSTANKRPTPAVMSDGQLAMNTNLASPGLFLKDSNGDLVKVGPVHVGTTAPNATPGAGGQAGNSKGEQWLDTSSSRYVFKIWDGTDWRTEDGEFVNSSGDTMTGALGIIAGTNTAPGVFFSGDTNTGIYSPGADQLAVATNGVERVEFGTSEVVFNDGGANYDFRIEGDTEANLVFVDASTDRVGIGSSAPNARLSVSSSVNTTTPLSIDGPGEAYSTGASAASSFVPTGTALSIATTTSIAGNAALIDIAVKDAGSNTTNVYLGAVVGPVGNGPAHLVFGRRTAESTWSESARIDSSGRLLVGTSAARDNLRFSATNYTPQQQLESPGQPFTSIVGGAAGGSGPYFTLGHQRSASVGGNTVLVSGDELGTIAFSGADGTNIIPGAFIVAHVDGTPGTDDMPGRLVFSTTADGASTPTERMRITSVGATNGSLVMYVGGDGFQATDGRHGLAVYRTENNALANAANSVVKIGLMQTTSRSINAAGTVNASGGDYAEYMTKAGNFTIAKGDICGITASGQLTTEFVDAVGFAVKSTNPSYVGGDTWGNAEVIGERPEDDVDAMVIWEAALEVARQQVDRIAFAGQVPVNVTGAIPSQYIVPIATEDGGITGIAKDEADLSLVEYMRAVGKVIAIEDDGRARIIVKVA